MGDVNLSVTGAVDHIGDTLRRGKRLLLGLTGPPGAGKSTVAEKLVASVPGAVLVPMDGFHLAQTVLADSRLGERKGAPDTFDRHGFTALLGRIAEQRLGDPPIYAPTFRRDIEEPIAGAIRVDADAPLVVTEGNYLLHWPEVRPLLDEVWWIDLDEKTRLGRLIARHVRFGRSPAEAHAWVMRSDEANARLIAPGRDLADLVIEME